MMRCDSPRLSSAHLLLLAAALLLAQWSMVQHQTDLAAHADHACEWRLAHTPFAADSASTPIVPPALLATVAPVNTTTVPLTAVPAAYQTRAPPLSFSV